jgi:putative membrane protein
VRTTAALRVFALLTVLCAGPVRAAVSTADQTFADVASQDDLTEIELGLLALQNATSPHVRQFAQRMVSDHTQAAHELMQVAKSQNLELRTQIDAQHKSDVDRLRGMKGEEFDTAYMLDMLQEHRKGVLDFQKQAQSGSDPALKSFAQKYLPALQQNLQMAQSIAMVHQ